MRRATRTFGLWWNNAGTTVSLSAPTKCLQNKTWHHVAIQRRYATFDLVLDGKVVSSYTAYGYQNAIGRGRSMWVGIDADENAEDFCGYMQDLRIYNRDCKVCCSVSSSQLWHGHRYVGCGTAVHSKFVI